MRFKIVEKVRAIESIGKIVAGKIYTVGDRSHDVHVYPVELPDHSYYDNKFEPVVGVKKVKQEERKYIVIHSVTDSIETNNLLTKTEAMDYCSSGDIIIDISKAPRYTKVTTSRMVEEKKKKKGK